MRPKIITPPASEPISIEDCRLHLRITETDEDAWILATLGGAREWAENFLNRSLAPQTLEIALDEFPSMWVELPGGPVTSVVSVTYVDASLATQTVSASSYSLDTYSEPQWLAPAVDLTWPAAANVANAVKVRYQAGYGVLPKSIRAALLLALGHLYENRKEASEHQMFRIPLGVESLLWPYRLGLGV